MPRNLVRIDEPERLRPLAQDPVEEGGLAGAVGSGEEDEGGHAARLTRSKADGEAVQPGVGTRLAGVFEDGVAGDGGGEDQHFPS